LSDLLLLSVDVIIETETGWLQEETGNWG